MAPDIESTRDLISAIEPTSILPKGKDATAGRDMLSSFFSSRERTVPIGDRIPSWWSPERDKWLWRLMLGSDVLSGAIFSTSARLTSIPVHVYPNEPDNRNQRRIVSWSDMLLRHYWGEISMQVAIDWQTQDNGAFIEILGAGDPGGPIEPTKVPGTNDYIYATGLRVLDSQRATRTKDTTYPVVYRHTLNDGSEKVYKLHNTRVIYTSQMPTPRAEMLGVGFCGVSRVVHNVLRLDDIILLEDEIMGSRPASQLVFGRGVDADELVEAFEKSDEKAAALNNDRRRTARTVFFTIDGSPELVRAAGIEMFDLKKLPQGYDPDITMNLAINVMAMGLGFDSREFWPATVRGATRADAEVQHWKSMKKTPGIWVETFRRQLGTKFAPSVGYVDFDQQDDEQDAAIAAIRQIRAETAALRLQSGQWDHETVWQEQLQNGEITEGQYGALHASEEMQLHLEKLRLEVEQLGSTIRLTDQQAEVAARPTPEPAPEPAPASSTPAKGGVAPASPFFPLGKATTGPAPEAPERSNLHARLVADMAWAQQVMLAPRADGANLDEFTLRRRVNGALAPFFGTLVKLQHADAARGLAASIDAVTQRLVDIPVATEADKALRAKAVASVSTTMAPLVTLARLQLDKGMSAAGGYVEARRALIKETTQRMLVDLEAALDDESRTDEGLSSIVKGVFSSERARRIGANEATGARTLGFNHGLACAEVVASKVWRTDITKDSCPECLLLDGEEITLDALFSNGRDGPPAHPGCNCAIEPGKIEDATTEQQGETVGAWAGLFIEWERLGNEASRRAEAERTAAPEAAPVAGGPTTVYSPIVETPTEVAKIDDAYEHALAAAAEARARAGVPLEPKPQDLTCAEAPRSASDFFDIAPVGPLNSKGTRAVMLDIDNVHGFDALDADGEGSRITIKTFSMYEDIFGKADGYYTYWENDIALGYFSYRITIAHEIGHALDDTQLFVTFEEGNPFLVNEDEQAWMRDHPGYADAVRAFWVTVKESAPYRDYTERLDRIGEIEDADERLRRDDEVEWLTYLQSPVELWARAYAQWLGIRSNDSEVIERARRWAGGESKIQWEEEDFAPIARAIDALMKERGLLK